MTQSAWLRVPSADRTGADDGDQDDIGRNVANTGSGQQRRQRSPVQCGGVPGQQRGKHRDRNRIGLWVRESEGEPSAERMARDECRGAVVAPARCHRTITEPTKVHATHQIEHVEDGRTNCFGPDDREQGESRPGDVAGEMSGKKPGSGAASTAGADTQQRQKRRARRQRISTAGDGGSEQQAGGQAPNA